MLSRSGEKFGNVQPWRGPVCCAAAVIVSAMVAFAPGCVGSGSNTNGTSGTSSSDKRQFPLSSFKTATITIDGNALRVWLALSDEQHMEGLMFVPENEIADDQGMLFVFPDEWYRSFWMKNTITALDIAFARMDGEIVKIHTMPPLTLDTFPSLEPAMFALEVKAGTFARLGIKEGDQIVIPPEVFKATP